MRVKQQQKKVVKLFKNNFFCLLKNFCGRLPFLSVIFFFFNCKRAKKCIFSSQVYCYFCSKNDLFLEWQETNTNKISIQIKRFRFSVASLFIQLSYLLCYVIRSVQVLKANHHDQQNKIKLKQSSYFQKRIKKRILLILTMLESKINKIVKKITVSSKKKKFFIEVRLLRSDFNFFCYTQDRGTR